MSEDRIPTVLFAFLNFNRGERAVASIRSVLQSTWPAEKLDILLLDNASTDNSVYLVEEAFGERVRIEQSPVNIGPVLRNRAILSQGSDYVFMFDEDCRPDSTDFVERAVSFMEGEREFGALCFACLNTHTGEREFGHPGGAYRRRLNDQTYEGIYVVGGGMMFRSDALLRTDGYDERIGFGGEEYDLAMELMHKEIPIAFRSDLVVLHDQAPRSSTPLRAWELDMRNNIWISLGRFPLLIAPVVALTHIARRLYTALSTGDRTRLTGTLRGIYSGVIGAPGFLRTRRPVRFSSLFDHRYWTLQMFVGRPLFKKRISVDEGGVVQ